MLIAISADNQIDLTAFPTDPAFSSIDIKCHIPGSDRVVCYTQLFDRDRIVVQNSKHPVHQLTQ